MNDIELMYTEDEIAKSFIEDVKAVEDLLPRKIERNEIKLKITYVNGDVRKVDCMAIEFWHNSVTSTLRLIACDGERINLCNVSKIETILEEHQNE